MEFNPAPEAIMRAGDELVVLGTTESVKALEKGVVA
jgi:K+/H+ antiporter YhaU regulatory subunit KhtT